MHRFIIKKLLILKLIEMKNFYYYLIGFALLTVLGIYSCDREKLIENADHNSSEVIEKGFSKINIDFITTEGKPYEAKRFVISNGTFYKEYSNITSIKNEIVPNNCSYRFVWHSGEYDTQDQLTLDLANKVYDFNFYCLDRNKTVSRVEPYVLIEEKDANAKLTYEWNESTNELTYSLDRKPGKIVDIVTWIDTKLLELPNYGLTSLGKNAEAMIGKDASVCFPPNVNLTISWGSAMESSDKKVNTVKLKFEKIPDNYTFVGIREATDNGYILPEPSTDFDKAKRIELLDANGKKIESKYIYPQFAVPNGLYYMTPNYISESEFYCPTIPVKVENNKASIFEYYPIKKNDLKPNTFHLVAEYYHTITNVKANFSDNKIQISGKAKQTKATNYSNYYYGVIVLDAKTKLKKINNLERGRLSILKQNNDYSIKYKDNLQIVSLRIPYSSDNFIVETDKL